MLKISKNKVLAIITAIVLMAALIPGLAHADTTTIPALKQSAVFTIGSNTVTVDGTPYTMDVAPYIDSNGRTQVPVRFLGDVLGMTAGWNAKTQTVNLDEQTWTGIETLVIGSNKLSWVNESQDGSTTMDTMPVIVPPGRTMLPARWVAQAIGYSVTWDQASQTVTVSPQGVTPGQPSRNGADGGVARNGGLTQPDPTNSVVPGGHNNNPAP